jgi:hypothetical protein
MMTSVSSRSTWCSVRSRSASSPPSATRTLNLLAQDLGHDLSDRKAVLGEEHGELAVHSLRI